MFAWLSQLGMQFGLWISTATLAAALGAAVSYGYAVLIAPTGLDTLGGPSNYYRPVEQMDNSVQAAESAMLRYSAGVADAKVVRGEFSILRERVRDVVSRAGTSGARSGIYAPQFAADLGTLMDVLDRVQLAIDALPDNAHEMTDPHPLSAVVVQMGALHAALDRMDHAAAMAEKMRRDAEYRGIRKERHILFASILAVLLASIATVIMMMGQDRRRRAMLAQQEAAITAERAASQAAKAAADTKNAFLGMLGHELRTPLQSIMSATDVLVGREFPERDALMVRRLHLAAERLDAQMKDLTDFARLDAGSLALRPELFDVNALAHDVIDDVRSQARDKGLVLEAVIEGGQYPVKGDPARIRQVLGNLLSNAVRYTSAGTVTVRLDVKHMAEGERLEFSVQDSGPGIPADAIERLFEPFVQLDQTNTREHEGAGIGLAIVKGLVDLMGGTVKLDTHPGSGTTVMVSLPVEVVERHFFVPPPRGHRSLGGYLILIVDDSEEAREGFADMVMSFGARCDVVCDGEEALEAVAETVYDAVLLDIQMPEMDGLEVARRIRRAMTMNRSTKIVGVSAYSTELLPADDIALFDRHLQKPVRADLLQTTLLELLGAGA